MALCAAVRRCASALYGVPCQWVAIGKLYGLSGVVQNLAATHHGGYDADCGMLNGYITCAISPLEILRTRTLLGAIASRRLVANAAATGAVLLSTLRAQGLACWGVGFAIWYDPASGGVQNATALHNRLLPPLTLAPDEARQVVVRCGLFSHLPSLLNSALGRTRAAAPPPWADVHAVIQWHAIRIGEDAGEGKGRDEAAARRVGTRVQPAAPPPRKPPRPARRRAVAWG